MGMAALATRDLDRLAHHLSQVNDFGERLAREDFEDLLLEPEGIAHPWIAKGYYSHHSPIEHLTESAMIR